MLYRKYATTSPAAAKPENELAFAPPVNAGPPGDVVEGPTGVFVGTPVGPLGFVPFPPG